MKNFFNILQLVRHNRDVPPRPVCPAIFIVIKNLQTLLNRFGIALFKLIAGIDVKGFLKRVERESMKLVDLTNN